MTITRELWLAPAKVVQKTKATAVSAPSRNFTQEQKEQWNG